MLKAKIVGAFVAVWCAVCLAYAGVRTAYGAVFAAVTSADEVAEGMTSGAESKDAASTRTELQVITEAPAEEVTSSATEPSIVIGNQTSSEEPEAKEDVTMPGEGSSAAETDGATVEESPTGIVDEAPEEVPVEEPVVESEAASVPSLYEYLSQFTCGSCRRNCSLANPHCHNGSRIADAKAQEYYALYGE